MSDRAWTSTGGGYRFGFNGMEKDDEVSGNGNLYTAEYWQYDPRLGRRWNLDPKPISSISPYATFANIPIILSDHEGDTVGYGSFRDRVNVFLARLTSKSFREDFKANKNDKDLLIYRGVSGAPSLKSLGRLNYIDTREDNTEVLSNVYDVEYSGIGQFNINVSINWIWNEKTISKAYKTRKKGRYSYHTLSRVKPGSEIHLTPYTWPDEFTLVDYFRGTVYLSPTTVVVDPTAPPGDFLPNPPFPAPTVLPSGEYSLVVIAPNNRTDILLKVRSSNTWPANSRGGQNRVQNNNKYRVRYTRQNGIFINFNISFTL